MPGRLLFSVGAAFALVAALSLTACGGGGGGDEDAIKSLVDKTAKALEDMDADAFEGLMSSDCEGIAAAMEETFSLLEELDMGEFKVNIENVEVRNVEDDSAEVLVEGTVEVAGEETDLSEGDDWSKVVKEDGKWRWADCEEFAGA